jgi:methyltransferase (TIGR00027 family)
MNEHSASRTALVTALMRARHTRLDPCPLIEDSLGDTLVPDVVRARLRELALAAMDETTRAKALAVPEAVVDDYLRNVPAYANVILRSRYTEDALRLAVSKGLDQYVLIGAGFDSFSLRRPPFARGVDVYEVDHPATQALKLDRLAACGVSIPASTHFIAADLGKESLGAALSRSPFRADQPAFLSWLGVTMYLAREANAASLRSIAECAAADSELVFSYLDEAVLMSATPSGGFRKLQASVASVGEPFLSGFDPAALGDELRQVGLTLIEDVNGEELVERYDSAGTNGLRCASTSHIAWARVAS